MTQVTLSPLQATNQTTGRASRFSLLTTTRIAPSLLAVSLSLAAMSYCIPAQAQDVSNQNSQADEDFDDDSVIIVTGTRRSDRTVADSTVPIDVIPAAALSTGGSTETNRLLNSLVPSFNFPQPSLTDGTDSLRPATLRGLSPDHTLVLVNGKRRHVSSLLNINGSVGRGSVGVDMNTIPSIAIERIEVLRDGASSQYGSDAIAGVINIQLKEDIGGKATISFGKYVTTMAGVRQVASVAHDGDDADSLPDFTFTGEDRKRRDGDTWTFATNIGLPIGEVGFFNFSGEYRDRSPTNRSGPDIRQNYRDHGDPRELTFNRYSHRFGDGESKDLNLFYNSAIEVGDNGWRVYSFGSYGIRNANGTGFYRRSQDARNRDYDTITADQPSSEAEPYYPDGFLPRIASTIEDIGIALGGRGEVNGWNLDLSVNYGSNRLDYNIENTWNVSLGGNTSPQRFDAGGLRSRELSANIDAQKDLDLGSQPLSVAFGGQYRRETYRIVPGDAASYARGPYAETRGAAAGSQVFGGFQPSTAVDASRTSFAGYLELETDIGDQVTLQAAGRYEHFSDFGSTINGKFAARFEPVEGFALRGSIASGFRAPGMAQQFFSTVSTNNIAGVGLVEVGTFRVSSPIARALGAQPLTPEKALNLGGGVTVTALEGLNLTIDYYRIKINDRITLTENLSGADVTALLQAANVEGSRARFFINGIDTLTQGLDIVASYRVPDFGAGEVTLNAGFNLNNTKITGRRTFSGFDENRLFSRRESLRLTDGQPATKFNIGLDWEVGNFAWTLRANRYGEVIEAGNSEAADIVLSPKWLVDLELRYRLFERINLAVGANNLFDTYPDTDPQPVIQADGSLVGSTINSFLPYSSLSPFGFSGRFIYGRVSVDF